MFDSIPIPVCLVLESEAVAMAGCLRPRRSIDEKERVINEMFLTEFTGEYLS